MKRKLTLLAVIFVLMSTGAFHSSKTEAGIFGKYGNLRPTIGSEDGELIIIYDCNYSLRSECTRSEF